MSYREPLLAEVLTCDQAGRGGMFLFTRNRFPGSHSVLISTSRSYGEPNALMGATSRSPSSTRPVWHTNSTTMSLPWMLLGSHGAGGARRNPATQTSSGGACLLHERAVQLEDVVGVLRRPCDRAGHHLGADEVEPVLETGDDPEVAATAPQAPEQLVVLLLTRTYDTPVRRDDLHRSDVVATPAEPAREVTEPAPQGEACDACAGDEAKHRRETVELRLAAARGRSSRTSRRRRLPGNAPPARGSDQSCRSRQNALIVVRRPPGDVGSAPTPRHAVGQPTGRG